MSRGPGIIERAIEAAFTSNPEGCFSVEELVLLAYPAATYAQKKHCVAVIRAADKVCKRVYWTGTRGSTTGRGLIYHSLVNERSYAHGRIRANRGDSWIARYARRNNEDCLASSMKYHFERGLMVEGGEWRRIVDYNTALRDGRHDDAEVQWKHFEAERQKATAMAMAYLRG